MTGRPPPNGLGAEGVRWSLAVAVARPRAHTDAGVQSRPFNQLSRK